MEKNEYAEAIIDNCNYYEYMALIQDSDIPKRYFSFKWGDYRFPSDTKGDVLRSRERAKKYCKDFTLKVEKEPKSIIIYGNYESKKTLLATLIARTLIEMSNKSVKFISYSDFVQKTRRDDKADELKNNLIEYDVIIIDEIIDFRINPYAANCLTSLIQDRKEMQKITIITSDLDVTQIRDRLSNRLSDLVSRKDEFDSITIL